METDLQRSFVGLWYKIWIYLSSVLSQCTRLIYGRADGQTELSSLDRVCIPCSAVKTVLNSIVRLVDVENFVYVLRFVFCVFIYSGATTVAVTRCGI